MINLYIEGICSLLVAIGCIAYLNRMRTRRFLDWIAFALAAAGSGGKALYVVWPVAQLGESIWDGMFFVGIAYIAVTQFLLDRRTMRVAAPERFTQVV